MAEWAACARESRWIDATKRTGANAEHTGPLMGSASENFAIQDMLRDSASLQPDACAFKMLLEIAA